MQNTFSPKTITIEYFASLAEQSKKSTEIYSTSAANLQTLWLELKLKYHFNHNADHLRAALNHRFCNWESEFKNNDIISFIPPVSGG